MSEESFEDLFARARGADETAQRELLQRIQTELHRLAQMAMATQRRAHTLQPTALVNEAFLKLRSVRAEDCKDWHHFVRIAAKAMRQILVDHARR